MRTRARFVVALVPVVAVAAAGRRTAWSIRRRADHSRAATRDDGGRCAECARGRRIRPVDSCLAVIQIPDKSYGIRHTKLAASSMLPIPVYRATCGYGHRGRVRSTFPAVL